MNRDFRLRIISDNQAVIGALSKESSSSYDLDLISLKFAVLVAAGNVKLDMFYVKCKRAPANSPSRCAEIILTAAIRADFQRVQSHFTKIHGLAR